MDRRSWWKWATPGALALGLWAGHAIATGTPTQAPLTWSGTVTDAAGKPVASAQDVSVAFYDAAVAGTLKCQSSTVQSEAGSGRFTVTLPADCAKAVHDTADLWSETTVGKTLLPRVHVGAVPYALEADTASHAGGELKASIDALKASPTGPWLLDSNGQKLGRVVKAAPDVVEVTTSNGYFATFYHDGLAVPAEMLYEGPNCAGTPYTTVYNNPTKFASSRNAYFNPSVGYLVADSVGAKAVATVIVTKTTSRHDAKGGCDAKVWSPTDYKQASIPMKKITPAELGLPANIAGPLSIVP